MADLTSVQSILRTTGGYRYQGFLTTPTEISVLEGTITADASEPALKLAYSTAAGVYTAVITDMEIVVTTSGNAFKGRVRVAPDSPGNAISATNLPISEISRGRLKIITGDKIKVMRSWRLRDLLVGATSSFPKDSRITYSNQNAIVAPVANMGGLWAGDENMLPAAFFGTRSYAMDGDSSGTLTYAHAIQDGTYVTGGATTGDFAASFPAGERWIASTVTDASNSAASKKYTWVRVHDEDDPPLSCQMEFLSGRRLDGWTARFSMPVQAEATLAAMPYGSLIVYYERERYAGVLSSYGGETGRSHIKFVGYLLSETITVDADTDTLTFEAVSPMAITRSMTAFSQILKEASSPATWQEYKNITVKQLVVYLVRWGMTLLDIFDLTLPFTDLVYPQWFIQAATPGDQLREVADAISCQLTCSRTGRFAIDKNLMRRTGAERDAATVSLNLTSADMVAIEATWSHRYQFSQLEASGFSAGSNPQPLRAIAPGEAPAEAPDRTTYERAIVTDQHALNVIAGYAYAESNSTYNGLPVPRGMTVTMPGMYDVLDPADFEYLNMSYTPPGAARRQVATNKKFILQQVDIRHDAESGAKEITWTVDGETVGEQGTTVVVTGGIGVELPNFNTEFQPVTVAQPTGGLNLNLPALYAFDDEALYKLAGFMQTPSAAGGPAVTRTALSVTGSIVSAVQCPLTPARAIVVTDNAAAIYTVESIYSATPTVTLRKTLRAAATGTTKSRIVDASINQRTIVVITHYDDDGGTWICTSGDDGVSWGTETQISANFETASLVTAEPGLHVSSRTAGTGLTSRMGATGCSEMFQTWGPTGNISPSGTTIAPCSNSTYNFSEFGAGATVGGNTGYMPQLGVFNTGGVLNNEHNLRGSRGFNPANGAEYDVSAAVAVMASACTVSRVEFYAQQTGWNGNSFRGLTVFYLDASRNRISRNDPTLPSGFDWLFYSLADVVAGVKYVVIQMYGFLPSNISSRLDEIRINGGATSTGESRVVALSSSFGTFTTVTTPVTYHPNLSLAGCVHVPFAGNTSESTVYFSGDNQSTTRFIKRKNADASVSDITPTLSGQTQRLLRHRALHTSFADRLLLLMATSGGGSSGVYMSRDGGDTRTQISAGTTTTYDGAEVVSSAVGVVWGEGGSVGYVDLMNGSIDERGVAAAFPGAGRIVRVMG